MRASRSSAHTMVSGSRLYGSEVWLDPSQAVGRSRNPGWKSSCLLISTVRSPIHTAPRFSALNMPLSPTTRTVSRYIASATSSGGPAELVDEASEAIVAHQLAASNWPRLGGRCNCCSSP